jgi:integrase/recombinase XerD
LIKKLSDANDTALNLDTQKTNVSSFAVRQKIKPQTGASFFSQAELYLENLKKTGKYNQYSANKSRVKHFKEFMNGQEVAFSDITVLLLERFKIYLKSNYKKSDSPMSDRTIINHLVVIRSVFSQAIKADFIDQKYYSFGAGKVKIKFPESVKIGLSPEEVKKLEDYEFPLDSNENLARNIWLFSFYLAGMRVSDVLRLKWSDIQDERLHYAMGKNAKVGSLKLPEKALTILSQYKTKEKKTDAFIFPYLKRIEDLNDKFNVQRVIATSTNMTDKVLREKVAPAIKLSKPLTMHIARHTFGNISGDKIPIQMLQKFYRHSSITTTIGYQANFIHKDADEALDAVISF